MTRFLGQFENSITSEVQNENPSIVAHSNRQKLLFQMVYRRISKISFFDRKNRFFCCKKISGYHIFTILACDGPKNRIFSNIFAFLGTSDVFLRYFLPPGAIPQFRWHFERAYSTIPIMASISTSKIPIIGLKSQYFAKQ